ncbi:MAG: hypothetical protein ICV59_05890 [Thermoleophilia bacterium]|nr:hypothetical protein [Thermoleophilia bacterium]
MMTHEKRAQNEQLFRAANDRLKDRLNQLANGGRVPFICECSDGDCLETVEVSPAKFDSVHADQSRFITRIGHESAGELVVERHDGFVVVEKIEPRGRVSY